MISFSIFQGRSLVKTIVVQDEKLIKNPASRSITGAMRRSANNLQEVMDILDNMPSTQAAGWGNRRTSREQ